MAVHEITQITRFDFEETEMSKEEAEEYIQELEEEAEEEDGVEIVEFSLEEVEEE